MRPSGERSPNQPEQHGDHRPLHHPAHAAQSACRMASASTRACVAPGTARVQPRRRSRPTRPQDARRRRLLEAHQGSMGHRQPREVSATAQRVAQLELNLWYYAANGGHTAPPPYTVRYDLARWLWHPSIAGAIFCLRCGSELWYTRGERTRRAQHRGADGQRRTARCRKCSRGRPHQWPKHAIEPYQQGTWLLRCTFPGCTNLFVGRPQARHCEHHRLNRLNPQLRPTNTRPPA